MVGDTPNIITSRSIEKTVVQQTSNINVRISTSLLVTKTSKVHGIKLINNNNDELVKLHTDLKKVLYKTYQ